MTQYKFRMFDRVRPVKEKAFTIGKVVSQGFGQGHAWYRVTVDSGDVYNCREDELEFASGESDNAASRVAMEQVEWTPKNRGAGMLPEDVFEMDLLRWRTPDHHPEEGEGIIFILKDRPRTDVWRGVFKDGKYHTWLLKDEAVFTRDEEAALFPMDEEAILCWSGFETPEVPGQEEESEEDEAWASGIGQAFSPDAEE